MTFILPNLPYAYDALQPAIDAQTMEIHHTKHHQAYITKLNAAIENTEYASWTLEQLVQKRSELPANIQTAVRNNAGGHRNHSMFWQWMTPGGKPMSDVFLALVNKNFGSPEAMIQQFSDSAIANFGSGWTWLVVDGETLTIVNTPNQDSPLMQGKKAILGLDTREHAYYLHYQNRRPDYIQNWWTVVDWAQVEKGL